MKNATLFTLLMMTAGSAYSSTIESFDVVLDSLNYTNPKESANGEAGTLQFNSLDFYSTDIFMNLYNDNKIFDSKLYVRDNFVGIRGSNHALGVNLENNPLMKIDGLQLGKSALGFNDKRVSVESESISVKHANADIKIKDLSFNSNKHPDHTGNSFQDLTYGVLSDSTVVGLNDGPYVTLDVDLRDIGDKKLSAKMSTKIKKVEFKTDRIIFDLSNTTFKSKGLADVKIENMNLVCNKDVNVTLADFDPNTLLLDCIDNMAFKISLADVKTEGEKAMTIKALNPAVLMDKKEVLVEAAKVSVQSEGFNFVGRHMAMSCEKNKKNIANNDIGAIAALCMDTSKIREVDGQTAMLDAALVVENIGNVRVGSRVNSIDMANGQFSTKLGKTYLDIGESISATSDAITFSCDPELRLPIGKEQISLDDLKLDEAMDKCINSVNLPNTKVFLKNEERSSRYMVDSKDLYIKPKEIKVDLKAVQSYASSGSTTIFDVGVDCYKYYGAKVKEVNKLVKGCLHSGKISVGKIVNDPKNKKIKNLKSLYDFYEKGGSGSLTPADAASGLEADMSDIVITSNNGIVSVKLKARVLGKLRDVELKGTIDLDEHNNKLIFNVNETHLPFGIDAMWLSMRIIKAVIADDRVAVDTKNDRIIVDMNFDGGEKDENVRNAKARSGQIGTAVECDCVYDQARSSAVPELREVYLKHKKSVHKE